MNRVLWIAPNLNHYKARFLNRLAQDGRLDLTVLAGGKMGQIGHRPDQGRSIFAKVEVKATKNNFHVRRETYTAIWKLLRETRFHTVLMPIEKKHLPLILFVFVLKFWFGFKLVSYNHPTTRTGSWNPAFDRIMTGFFFKLYDRIIFYTREGRDLAVDSGLLPSVKAFYANNTLDTAEIWANYSFEVNRSDPKVLLFIGRLIKNKRLGLLLKYFEELKSHLPGIRLIVIGDGPEAEIIKAAAEKDEAVTWLGAVVDEARIASVMRQVNAVFVPGWSGLSIVHAFCYGKPYITIKGPHPPEIDYLKDGRNGLILDGDLSRDARRIAELLTDKEKYEQVCRAAFQKAQELSVENWCARMKAALADT